MIGLQLKIVAVDCLRLSKSRLTPDGWNKDAIDTLVHKWKTIITLEGKELWLRMNDGHTQYSSPEVEGAIFAAMDDNILACWGDLNEPGHDIVHQEVVFVPPPDSLLKQEIR